MNIRNRGTACAAACVLLLAVAVPAHAAEQSGRIDYVSGGVSLPARDALLAQARDQRYNLHLEFVAAPAGEYLADVQVTITDARGSQILSTRTEGPWLFARVPPGSYKVTARYGDTSRTQALGVGEGRHRIVMRFPAADGQAAEATRAR